MFDFGLYTQLSDSGPHGPLVSLKSCQVSKGDRYVHIEYCSLRAGLIQLKHNMNSEHANYVIFEGCTFYKQQKLFS